MQKFLQVIFKNFLLTTELQYSKIIIQTCRQNILWVQVYCLFICFFILTLVSLISCSKVVTQFIKSLTFLGKVSSGFKKANLVLMTRDATENDRNVSTKTVAATFENYFGSAEVSSEKVWEKFGFFDARKSENSLKKVNFPKNTLIYLNQSYLTVKENKKIFYCDYFITGQLSESSNPPQDVSSHTLKENEVEMVTSRYDLDMSEFKGLY